MLFALLHQSFFKKLLMKLIYMQYKKNPSISFSISVGELKKFKGINDILVNRYVMSVQS